MPSCLLCRTKVRKGTEHHCPPEAIEAAGVAHAELIMKGALHDLWNRMSDLRKILGDENPTVKAIGDFLRSQGWQGE